MLSHDYSMMQLWNLLIRGVKIHGSTGVKEERGSQGKDGKHSRHRCRVLNKDSLFILDDQSC